MKVHIRMSLLGGWSILAFLSFFRGSENISKPRCKASLETPPRRILWGWWGASAPSHGAGSFSFFGFPEIGLAKTQRQNRAANLKKQMWLRMDVQTALQCRRAGICISSCNRAGLERSSWVLPGELRMECLLIVSRVFECLPGVECSSVLSSVSIFELDESL